MNYHRNLKRKIKTHKRLMLLNGFICVTLFAWIVFDVSLNHGASTENIFEFIIMTYAGIVTGMLEAQIEKLEAELLRR